MNNEKKIKLLFIAVIFLAALNIATFSSIIWHMNNEGKAYNSVKYTTNQNYPYWRGQGRGRYGYNTSLSNVRFNKLMDSLNLNAKQRSFFVEKRQDFIYEHRILVDSLRIYRHLINQEICSDKPDDQLIDLYARRIGDLHYRFVRDNATLYLQYKSQLNRKQQTVLCRFLQHPARFFSRNRKILKK